MAMMQAAAERLGERLNSALRGETVDLPRLARSWRTLSMVAYEASEARARRADAVEAWAHSRQSPRTGARVAAFVAGLWRELAAAAVAHDHPAGFAAIWGIVSYAAHVRFIAATSDHRKLARFLQSDPCCLRRLLLAVPAGDDETFDAVLAYVVVDVRDLRLANTPAQRQLMLARYYHQFFN